MHYYCKVIRLVEELMVDRSFRERLNRCPGNYHKRTNTINLLSSNQKVEYESKGATWVSLTQVQSHLFPFVMAAMQSAWGNIYTC